MSSAVHSSRVALLGVTQLCSYVSTHLKDVEIHRHHVFNPRGKFWKSELGPG